MCIWGLVRRCVQNIVTLHENTQGRIGGQEAMKGGLILMEHQHGRGEGARGGQKREERIGHGEEKKFCQKPIGIK